MIPKTISALLFQDLNNIYGGLGYIAIHPLHESLIQFMYMLIQRRYFQHYIQ